MYYPPEKKESTKPSLKRNIAKGPSYGSEENSCEQNDDLFLEQLETFDKHGKIRFYEALTAEPKTQPQSNNRTDRGLITQNSDTSRVTKSGNFCYGSTLSDKHKIILKEVENSPYSITPKEISSNTGLKAATVRKYLRDLEKGRLVKRKFRGHYVSMKNLVTNDRRMVHGFPEVKVHSVRFRVVDVGGGERSWCRDFGVLKLKFVVHGNRTAEVFVDCGKGVSLDYVAFRLVVGVVCGELGCSWGQVSVVSCEFNRDFFGVRLDGVKAVTLRSFDGSFRRVYNHRGFLRDEVKTVGSKKIEDVLALMQGGISQYNIQQFLYVNFQKWSEYVEATKFSNRLVSDAVSEMRRLVKAMVTEKDKR